MAEVKYTMSSPNDSEKDNKRSPLGKMLSRSSSLFMRSPIDQKAPIRSPDSFDTNGDRVHISPNSRLHSLSKGTSFEASIESSFESSSLPRIEECLSLISSDTASTADLKSILSRTADALIPLKSRCVEIEESYKAALVKATSEYQKSVNELFDMEQKLQSEDSVEGLQFKLRNTKERTIKIDKERRAAMARLEELERINSRMEVELQELREVTGGSMDEIRMWAVDAKMTRVLMADLAEQKSKVEFLERELNHDKNHFAEMAVVFDDKSKDFKSRMETLEEQHTEMARELTKAEREAAVNYEEMNSYKTALSRTNDRMRQLLETTVTKMEYEEELQRRKVAEMKAESEASIRKNLEKQLEQTHHKFLHHIEELQEEVESATLSATTANTQKFALEEKCNAQKVELDQLKETVATLSQRVEVLTEERNTSVVTYIERIEAIETAKRLAEEKCEIEAQELRTKLSKIETLSERQQCDITSLHNQIDDLKGNIRVFARIRPMLPEEVAAGQTAPAVIPLSGGYSLRIGKSSQNAAMLDGFRPDDPESTRSFSYDKVFPPTISQRQVFEEVSEYIKATMEGHATCLMSYGQTGSGKTYSMQGASVDPSDERRGIIPRAMEEIVKQMEVGKQEGWSYVVKVSFIQIYLENVHDLLRETDEDVKHEIKKMGNSVVVTDVNMMTLDPSDTSQITKIMNKAARMRNVAATGQNAESSRSHAIFTLHIHGENVSLGQEFDGTMYLVDLAGSERLSKSQASGETLKETQFINKSLSALGDVFMAIAQKSSHVPYRNSKLTYLLQTALSGYHKTLMIVHLSPAEESYGKSLCTIRFATQVNSYSATGSLRSMSFSGGDQASGVNSRSPSLTKMGIASKSPRNSLTLGPLRGNSVTASPPTTPTANSSTRQAFGVISPPPRSPTRPPDDNSPTNDSTSLSKKVRGIAKVFTFDFEDEDTPADAATQQPENSMDEPMENEADIIPEPPSLSSPLIKRTKSGTVSSSPSQSAAVSKRGGYMSLTRARSDVQNSPEKPQFRKTQSTLSRSSSSKDVDSKKLSPSKPLVRPGTTLPPPSPKISSPVKKPTTATTLKPRMKSTF